MAGLKSDKIYFFVRVFFVGVWYECTTCAVVNPALYIETDNDGEPDKGNVVNKYVISHAFNMHYPIQGRSYDF